MSEMTINSLSGFTDHQDISDWALRSVALCIQSNVITGDNGKLNPDRIMTRAEAAALILRILQESGLI